METLTNKVFATLAVALIHAYALGSILTFGSYAVELQTDLNATRTQVALLGDIQYGLFFASAVIVYILNNVLDGGHEKMASRRYASLPGFFVLLWLIGTLVGTDQRSYDSYAIFYITFTGLGAGLLYWHSLSSLPSWFGFERHPNSENARGYKLALLVVTLSPHVFQSIYSTVFLNMNRRTATYYVLGVAGTGVFTFASMFLRVDERKRREHRETSVDPPQHPDDDDSDDDDEENLNLLDKLHDLPDAVEAAFVRDPAFLVPGNEQSFVWLLCGATHTHMLTFLFAAGVFQFAVFAPYVVLPDFCKMMTKSTPTQTALTMSLLGVGASAGRCLAGIWAYQVKTDHHVTATIVYMVCSTVWLCSLFVFRTPESMHVFAVVHGFFSAAALYNVLLTVSVNWPGDGNQYQRMGWLQKKYALLALYSLPGSFTSAFLFSRIVESSGHDAAVGFMVGVSGLASALLLITAASFVYAKKRHTTT